MARKSAEPPPPPPFVWGPSEINRWIEGAYPSKKRPSKPNRRRVPIIEGLRIRCRADARSDVRRSLADGLRRLGFSSIEESSDALSARSPDGDHAVARTSASLRRRTYAASIRFDPAVRPASARRIVRLIGERVEVLSVTYKRAR